MAATASGATGSSFSLNTGGAVVLDDLAQILTGAGVSVGVTVEAGQGSLSLNKNLTASYVSLTADGGLVAINGAVTANGTASTVGEIDLYGTAVSMSRVRCSPPVRPIAKSRAASSTSAPLGSARIRR